MGIQKGFWGVLVLAAACSSPADNTSTASQAATSSNGVYQNGLVQNGVYQNGLTTNGVYQNGVYQNGVYQNGVYQNGVYQNGVYQNGVYQNGLWVSGLWSNTTWQVGTNATALATNPYTRQFFQYVYACAMPGSFDPAIGPPTDPAAQLAPGYYSTSLDPNNGTLACNASGGCDDPYYTCDKGTNTCVVQLTGAVGLGVNADGTTWWNSGRCDESCQRWVSACVLARTNAYGVHVDISMRAPADAPAVVKNALYVTDTERTGYTLREGAYFGNVFETQPVNPQPAGSTYTGDPGPLVAAPQFFACAGPGSNIPEITKRFCSSQGDQAVIAVPGTCLPTGAEKPVCSGEDTDTSSPTFGAIQDCYTSTTWTNLTPYQQVVTVYLKEPISVCGNAVCEKGEDDTSSASYCPSDCHVGAWAKSISNSWFTGADDARESALDPTDGSTVVASSEASGFDVTIDNTITPPLVLPADACAICNVYGTDLVIVKYAADGSVVWGKRMQSPLGQTQSNVNLTVGPDHAIYIASNGPNTSTPRPFWIAKLTPDGNLDPSWATNPLPIASQSAGVDGNGFHLALDSKGNLDLVGGFYPSTSTPGTVTFGTVQLPVQTVYGSLLAAKISPQGTILWATHLLDAQPTDGSLVSTGIAIDGNDDIVTVGYLVNQGGLVYKLGGADGAVLAQRTPYGNWLGLGGVRGVAVDPTAPTSAYYVAAQSGVAKLASDLSTVWVQHISGSVENWAVTVDPAGNAITLVRFFGQISGVAGLFNAYAVDHWALTGYSSTGAFLWAKHVPTILGAESVQSGFGYPKLAMDPTRHVRVTASFAGSMQLDDRMLVGLLPETKHGNTFVGSFVEPSPTDTTITIGDAIDQAGLHLVTVPNTITAEATSSAGAPVWYMPPTALDVGGAGTNVTCTPASSSMFPIGTTKVTCTATNALGYTATAGFDVVVHDTLGPTMSGIPASVTSTTATVTYTLPTAVDQVSGAVPVTCSPASGSVFATGTTIVTCTAKDQTGNTTQATFTVTVTAPPDSTPPVITVPGAMTVPASGPGGAVVTYTATATDNVDGAITPTCTPVSGSQLALGTTTVTCTATDAHSNTATASFTITVKDMTPPTVIVPSGITVQATGPAGAVATFAAAATDNVDGAIGVSCTPASGAQFALGTTTVTCSAHDAAGNVGSASFPVTVVDTTPPAIHVPAPITAEATGASGATVTFVASATDLVDGAIAPSCSPASGSTFALGTTTVTCTAIDAHHNSSSASFTVTVVDTTPPAITVPGTLAVPATGSTTVVTYTTSARDLVDGAVATTCTPASGSAFALGTTTVTCTATDARGNTATRSFLVETVAQWSGFLQPINPDGSSIFHLGSTVAVKFQLTGASAGITNAVANLTLAKLTSAIDGTSMEAVSTSAADIGNQFRYDPSSQQYIFNLATSGLSVGTWQLRVDLHDGVNRTINISLK